MVAVQSGLERRATFALQRKVFTPDHAAKPGLDIAAIAEIGGGLVPEHRDGDRGRAVPGTTGVDDFVRELAVLDAFACAERRAIATVVSVGCDGGLLAEAVAGDADGPAVSVELLPGAPLNMLTMNMMAKATATAARVTRGLRCFTAPPPPDGYACWG